MSVVPIRPEVMAAIMDDPGAIGRPASRFLQRGYAAVYHRGEVNHCPGCGRCNWWVRTRTAECAFCSTALPLVQS